MRSRRGRPPGRGRQDRQGLAHRHPPAAHLICALTGAGCVVSQARVPDKTTEVTALPPLLAPFDLAGITVTADALHTNADEARFLVEDKRAHYVLVVKQNQKTLFNAVRALPWTSARRTRQPGEGPRPQRDTNRAGADRHRPWPGPPAPGAGRSHPPLAAGGDDRQGLPQDRLRHHRPHVAAGITGKDRTTRTRPLDHREP
ncbi:transposase [Streptomyces melanogenes]